jgi:hypothetical protein
MNNSKSPAASCGNRLPPKGHEVNAMSNRFLKSIDLPDQVLLGLLWWHGQDMNHASMWLSIEIKTSAMDSHPQK